MILGSLGSISYHHRVSIHVRSENRRNQLPRACTRHSALSTPALDHVILSPWHHGIVVGSHWLCKTMRPFCLRCYERLVLPFCTHQGLLAGVTWAIALKHYSTFCNSLHHHVSVHAFRKPVPIRCYARALTIVFL